jgi:hypothetical protein
MRVLGSQAVAKEGPMIVYVPVPALAFSLLFPPPPSLPSLVPPLSLVVLQGLRESRKMDQVAR